MSVKTENYSLLLLLLPLLLIMLWRNDYQERLPEITKMPGAMSADSLSMVAGGDNAFIARVLMIWMQQYDTQSGRYIPYGAQDYSVIEGWLQRLQQLDPTSGYPMLMATRIYTFVKDKKRLRKMLEFVYSQFQANPEKNWHWLAEAVVLAKHRLKDTVLALKYARALSESTALNIPRWARDSYQHIQQGLTEKQQMELIYGGMVSEGILNDPNEIKEIDKRLKNLQN